MKGPRARHGCYGGHEIISVKVVAQPGRLGAAPAELVAFFAISEGFGFDISTRNANCLERCCCGAAAKLFSCIEAQPVREEFFVSS